MIDDVSGEELECYPKRYVEALKAAYYEAAQYIDGNERRRTKYEKAKVELNRIVLDVEQKPSGRMWELEQRRLRNA